MNLYSTHDTSRISGLSPRQLRWAVALGHLRPANHADGFRQHHRFGAQQVIAAYLLAQLMERGVGPSRRWKLLNATRPALLDRASVVAATVRGAARVFDASEEYLTIVRDPVTVIDLDVCRRRMREAMAA